MNSVRQTGAVEGDPTLRAFLRHLADPLADSTTDPQIRTMAARLKSAAELAGSRGVAVPRRLPVCVNLQEAAETARGRSATLARVIECFMEIEPRLEWARRPSGGPFASDDWPEGHANATIIGSSGLETREGLQVGVSIMARNVRYPDHHHAPEEVYLVLSPGRFQHGDSDWWEPGIGGTLYNSPNIKHAMASGDAPLLAIWSLWDG